jgi:schlafen family protein
MDKPASNFLKPPIGRRLRLIMLFFTLLFSLSAIAQYLFIKYQLDRARSQEAETWVAEINKAIGYTTKWNLKEFRQADWEAPSAFIFATNGVLVDLEGFTPGLTPPVALPSGLDYDHPKDYVSEIGETWRLLAKRVRGGTVVLGISYVYNLAIDDETLLADANKFGTTLETASNIHSRDISADIECCVVDDFGNLQYAVGGIPVKAKTAISPITSTQLGDVAVNGRSYSVYTMPVLDSSNSTVGTITVPINTTSEHKTLGNAVRFNMILSGASWLVVSVLTTSYFIKSEGKKRAIDISVDEALRLPESDTLEFKSSVRWDYNKRQVNKGLEDVIVKTVVAFLNTSGGVLVIGVDDDRTIKGLQPDYDSLTKKNRDGLELHLQQIISERLGADRYQLQVSMEFHTIDGKDVCLIRIKPAPKPVVMREQNQPCLYVRAGNATRSLNVEETIRYVQEHWSGFF